MDGRKYRRLDSNRLESSGIVWSLDDSSQRLSICKTLRKRYSKKDEWMIENTDDWTRIKSNRLEFRRLVLEAVDLQDS